MPEIRSPISGIKKPYKVCLDVLAALGVVGWVFAMGYWVHVAGINKIPPRAQIEQFDRGHHTNLGLAYTGMFGLLIPFVLGLVWFVFRLFEGEKMQRRLVYTLMKLGDGERLAQAGYGEWLEEMGYKKEGNFKGSILKILLIVLVALSILVVINLVSSPNRNW